MLRIDMLGGHRPDFEFAIEREPDQDSPAPGEPAGEDWIRPFFRQIDHRFGLSDEGDDSVENSPDMRYLEPILADMRGAAQEDPDSFVLVLVMGFAFLRYYQAVRDPGVEASAIEVLDRILHGDAARFDRVLHRREPERSTSSRIESLVHVDPIQAAGSRPRRSSLISEETWIGPAPRGALYMQ